jgi:cation diffusion facilitator CzcD-associated flavoprotein CzcO
MKKTNLNYDVVVVGAGPYGLSVGAHLKNTNLNVAMFGKTMSLWSDHMPVGMNLRSRWWASSLSDPKNKYSISDYLKTHKIKPYDPFKSEALIDYGKWFEKNNSLKIDQTFIKSISRNDDGTFILKLENDKTITSNKVVLAAGIAYYVHRPEEFSKISKKFISHTFDNLPFSKFKGKKVLVVGGGQSALENSALMCEAGIDVTVVSRKQITWLSPNLPKTFWQNLKSPKAGIADGWDNWGLEHYPYLFQRLPYNVKVWYLKGKGQHGPAGSDWLSPRLKKATIYQGVKVEKVEEKGSKVTVKLSNGETVKTDHIILATGYKVDIKRLPMLDKKLLSEIKTKNGSPVLNSYFESSIKGLYFTGIASQASMGPLFRFVVGSDACAKRIVTSISRAMS